ncbi:C40 family peptidase [Streptomyces sp. VRA16 Mangrove soil]|uniref:C40 family peptidase n=1 Tax=Streptomyces sp. VRA16 Mangrove soil TaxID=2817434 RepID=UPI001A9D84EB|nr:C40 family peptidase [Streptomyces sp. VRA16 Mangrove soil]MBO1336168.1 C40 family peptidase [Streptomyces sp. VRA16 Mangrove soil]
MSGRLLRWVCTAAVAGALLAPGPAGAAPEPGPDGENRSVAELLTELQGLYRQAEEATEAYNTTAEELKGRRKEADALDGKLAKARGALYRSRLAAGRLARQQYQGRSEISPYVQLLLARDPQHAVDQGHVIRRAQREQEATVDRLVRGEKQADELATRAQGALDEQLQLADRQKKDRDTVQARLKEVEELLASLSAEQLAQLTRLEDAGTADAQRAFMASGALSSAGRAPSKAGDAALAYAVRQIGKPYVWGAEGPASFDCSGLTSQAWARAGRVIPRTSQEQWARLPRVPLSELRPGDLVVYFPKATHVAMYLGDGMVVQAPRPGARVKVSPIAANPLLGAVRPDPGAVAMSGYRAPVLPPDALSGQDTGYAAGSAP